MTATSPAAAGGVSQSGYKHSMAKKSVFRKLLNTTVYDGDDVVSIVEAVMADAGRGTGWTRIKVRYLQRPIGAHKMSTDDGLTWARVSLPYGTTTLTVSLLAPSKIGVLDALARVGDGEAHERIARDLIWAMETHYYTGLNTTDATRALKIRLHEAADAHEKLRSAYENLTSDVRSRAETLASRKARLAAAQREVARLEARIPGDEAKLASVKARLDKATTRMKAAGLL